MKLKKYEVIISDGVGILRAENTFEVKEFNVLAENTNYIVIDDNEFTTIAKSKSYSYTKLNEQSIRINSGDKFWGNRVAYTLYTFKNKRAKTIKNEIENKINEKFGFFMRGLDLSFIRD